MNNKIHLKHTTGKLCLLLLFCLASALPTIGQTFHGTPAENTSRTSLPDSLLTDRYIRHIYTAFPDSALKLLDIIKMQKQPRMQPYRIDLLRAIVYEFKQMHTLKEKFSRRALENDSIEKQPGQKLQALCYLSYALMAQGKYEESIQTAINGINLARELKNRVVECSLLHTMAQTSFELKRSEDGFGYLQQAIDLIGNSDNVRELAQLSYTYGELMTAFASEKLYEKAIQAGLQRKEIIKRMSGMAGPPQGYIDQQYAYLYSKLALYHQNTGKRLQATEAYNNFLATDFAHTPQGAVEAIPYLLETRQYRQVLETNLRSKSRFEGQDTLNHAYLTLLQNEAEAWRGLGDYKRADNLGRRIAAITGSIYAREKESRAQELGVVFQLNEKDMLLREAKATSKRRNILFMAACAIGVMLGVLLWNQHINLIRTRRRNRIAIRQIDELLAQKEELHKVFDREQSAGSNVPERDVQAENRTETGTTENGEDYACFMKMESALMREKWFLQPNFGRNELIQLTHLDKNRLSKLIQEYAGMNLSDYLNKLRVEYSVTLMQEKPHFSNDAIATEAGFSSRSTFYAAFSKNFGMTPTQYRKN